MRPWRRLLGFSLAPCVSNAPFPSSPAAKSNSMVVSGGLWGEPPVPGGQGEGRGEEQRELPVQGLLRSPTQPGSESLALTHRPSPAPPSIFFCGKWGGWTVDC